MNPATILGLIVDLYETITSQQIKIAQLEAQIADAKPEAPTPE